MSKKNSAASSGDEVRAVGDWDAQVSLEKHNKNHRAMKRTVKTRGIKRYNVIDPAQIVNDIRTGYEVRIISGGADVIRFYPCLDTDYKTMFIAAQPLKPWRNSIADIKFHKEYHGKRIDDDELNEIDADVRKRYEEHKEAVKGITPDLMVTCPQCSYKFRVGQKIAA